MLFKLIKVQCDTRARNFLTSHCSSLEAAICSLQGIKSSSHLLFLIVETPIMLFEHKSNKKEMPVLAYSDRDGISLKNISTRNDDFIDEGQYHHVNGDGISAMNSTNHCNDDMGLDNVSPPPPLTGSANANVFAFDFVIICNSFIKNAHLQKHKKYKTISNSVAAIEWNQKEVPTLPDFHLLEQTTVSVENTSPLAITKQINTVLREHSINATYNTVWTKVKDLTTNQVNL